jgi:hypothetical protein
LIPALTAAGASATLDLGEKNKFSAGLSQLAVEEETKAL